MAEDREADSRDESASAARPDGEEYDENVGEDSEVVEEHVAPDDAREPTADELEQLLESDEADAPKASLHDVGDRSETGDDPVDVGDSDSDDGEDDGESDDDSGRDADGELVSVGAATTRRRSGAKAAADGDVADTAVAARAGKGRSKKDRATPKQKKAVEKRKRTTPVSFVKEAVGELRKVVYPTAPQLGNYFVVVLVFVLIIIGFVSLLDLGFGWVIVKVFS